MAHANTKQRITAQVLNGATGEMREVIAHVEAETEQDAVNKLFARARRAHEQLWVYSMGKRFRVRAITDSVGEWFALLGASWKETRSL